MEFVTALLMAFLLGLLTGIFITIYAVGCCRGRGEASIASSVQTLGIPDASIASSVQTQSIAPEANWRSSTPAHCLANHGWE